LKTNCDIIKKLKWNSDTSFVFLTVALVGFPSNGIPVIKSKDTQENTNEYLIEIIYKNILYKIYSGRDSFKDMSLWLPDKDRAIVYIDGKQSFYCNFTSILQKTTSIQCDKSTLSFSNEMTSSIRIYSSHKEEADTFVDCL